MSKSASFLSIAGFAALLWFTAATATYAQTTEITGRVAASPRLDPLVGVTVTVQGDTTISAVTDSTGSYAIAVLQPDATLLFRTPGYLPQAQPLEGRSVLNVLLDPAPISIRINPETPSSSSCEGAAMSAPPGFLEPTETPRRMSPPDAPPAAIPNACGIP